MRNVKILAGLSLLTLVCLSTVAKAGPLTQTMTQVVPNAVVMSYDPTTGQTSYDGNGRQITTFELKSAGGILNPAGINAGVGTGPFDVKTAAKFFTLTTAPNQVSHVDIGALYAPGLSAADIIADADLGGSLFPQGALSDAEGGGPYLFVVPEPSSIALVFCGLLGLLGLRRKQA